MAQLRYGDNPVNLNFGDDNKTLAILQVATFRRFATGKGYFITAAGTDDGDGRDVSSAHWIGPGSPLRFNYDVEDVYGNHVDTVVVEEDDVEAFLDAMDHPIGVLFGFSAERGHYVPFIDAETRAAANESAPQQESGRGTDS